jgi:hypothetical protein
VPGSDLRLFGVAIVILFLHALWPIFDLQTKSGRNRSEIPEHDHRYLLKKLRQPLRMGQLGKLLVGVDPAADRN